MERSTRGVKSGDEWTGHKIGAEKSEIRCRAADRAHTARGYFLFLLQDPSIYEHGNNLQHQSFPIFRRGQ
jgi:hypothetical protein